jgi:hypothetical protein
VVPMWFQFFRSAGWSRRPAVQQRLHEHTSSDSSRVAERLGVPTSWVYEQSRRGVIPTVALGRYRRSRAGAIASMVEQLEQAAARRGA